VANDRRTCRTGTERFRFLPNFTPLARAVLTPARVHSAMRLTPAHVADARKKVAAGQSPNHVAEFYRVSRAALSRALAVVA
jgi:hypothetical protein